MGLLLSFLSNLLVVPAEIDKEYNILSFIYVTVSALLFPCAMMLVFISVLEFILAQGPQNMQGLMIGLWYGYQLAPNILSLYLRQYSAYKFSTIRTCACFVSFVLFLIASLWYKHRQMNESSDINTRNVIEEYTEGRLLRENDNNSNIFLQS